jgi:hypothetical protein
MQRISRFVSASVATAFLAIAPTALAQGDNPHIGTWKANIAKSKFASGTAANSTTTRIEAAGAGVRATVDTDYADGTRSHWVFTANYDGKDSPITGNCPYGETVAMTRVDARTSRSVYKHNGTVTVTQTAAISPDGKTRTVTSKGKNLKGQAIDNVNVYDRQ